MASKFQGSDSPLLCWGYRGLPLWPALQLGVTNTNSEPSATATSTLLTKPSPKPIISRVLQQGLKDSTLAPNSLCSLAGLKLMTVFYFSFPSVGITGMDYRIKLYKISAVLDSGHQTFTGGALPTKQSLPYLFFKKIKHNYIIFPSPFLPLPFLCTATPLLI